MKRQCACWFCFVLFFFSFGSFIKLQQKLIRGWNASFLVVAFCSVLLYWRSLAKGSSRKPPIGRLRVQKTLSFKPESFLVKTTFIVWKWKIIFISMTMHLASLWNIGLGQLGNGSLKSWLYCSLAITKLLWKLGQNSSPKTVLQCTSTQHQHSWTE